MESILRWQAQKEASFDAKWGGSTSDGEIRLNKENIPSRAYLAFKNEDDLAIFSRAYDGHLFRDKAGVIRLLIAV